MAIAAIYNVPGTPEEEAVWANAHAAHHRDINATFFRLFEISLPDYILDPFDRNSPGVWLYQHQDMHNTQNALLGIAGFDLTTVDWKDENQLYGWIWIHAQEHFQAGNILGIG